MTPSCLVSTAVPLPARHGPHWSRRGKTVANPVCRCRGSTSNPPPVTMTGSWPPRTGPAGSTTAPGGVSSGCWRWAARITSRRRYGSSSTGCEEGRPPFPTSSPPPPRGSGIHVTACSPTSPSTGTIWTPICPPLGSPSRAATGWSTTPRTSKPWSRPSRDSTPTLCRSSVCVFLTPAAVTPAWPKPSKLCYATRMATASSTP